MRRVAQIFGVQALALLAMAITTCTTATAGDSDGANIRIASYQTASGENYFAASVQPNADDALMSAAKQADSDVVIVVDTSASQVGGFRLDAMAAVEGILSRLRAGDRVRLFAGDVKANSLSNTFDKATSVATGEAIQKLRKRLPLGNTNMVSVIDSVRASLVSQPRDRTRSIIYIGDGASIDTNNARRFGILVDALRADRIAVHSIAIGPTTNVQLMAILANQTGGVLGVVGSTQADSANAIARSVGTSSTISPIWIKDAQLLKNMTAAHGNRLPPMRIERDTILLGKFDPAHRRGRLALVGETTNTAVQINADARVEAPHPDFAFLPGLVKDAVKDSGLTLPTAGSPLLREVARMRTLQAQELVRAGNIALQQGNKRGAKAVAELALEADPNNQEAKSLEKISGNRLVMQNGDSPFDDIFGGSSAPAPAGGDTPAPAGGDPFGGPAEPAGGGADPFGGAAGGDPAPAGGGADPFGGAGAEPAPAAGGGADPFGGGDAAPAPVMDDDSPFGAAAAAPEVADTAPAPPPAPRDAKTLPTPGAVAPAPAPGYTAPPTGDAAYGRAAGDDEVLEVGGGLLRQVEQQRSLVEGRLQAEVRAQTRWAQRTLRTNPVGVGLKLKSLLSTVETTPDVNPQLRQELESQLRTAIQIASRREAEFIEEQFNLEQQQQAATSTARLLEETFRREATLDTLSRQMNALIDEGRYTEADGEVSLESARIAGDTITRDSVWGRHVTDMPLALQTYARDRRYREMRERNFVDAFSLVMKSNIPFVDEPPIHYPDADIWQRMSRRRLKRYGAIELVGDNETERRIQASLNDETTQTFVETPLEEAVATISRTHDIPIVVDKRALEEIGLTPDTPVNVDLKNVSLRSFMRLMLRELDLTYMIKDEVMQITTVEAAEQNLINKVYPVGDLVVPIIQMGGGGMGGGGMGGGGMGGGGMGGGGMGGGMGGGGMGGGGMGGGGMFAVPDDISLGSKATATKAAPTKSAPTQKSTKPATSRAAVNVDAIRITPKANQTKADAWDEFFAGVKITNAEELTILDQRIRTTVRYSSMKAAKAQKAGNEKEAIAHFADARETIEATLRSGNVQPWMYQAYAISLKATNAPKEDVERALLSAVDFAETPEEVLHVAARLEDIGSRAAALRLCKNVSEMDEYRREPYVMGMRIAEKLNDIEGLRWSCRGILSQAWPEQFKPVVDRAKLLARATYAQLLEEGRKEDAKKFSQDLKLASSHDVIVRVRWTGDADIDTAIEEPSGTVCSVENRTTSSGGTLLGDAFPGHGDDETGAVSETYICPKGFTGTYRLLLRRVWGNVTTGNVTVEILTDVGRPSQRFIRQQVPITEKDALLVFEVKDGQRKKEIAEAQLEHLRDVQRDVRGDVLAQFALGGGAGFQAPGADSGQALQDLFRDVQRLTGGTGGINGGFVPGPRGFVPRGAVGFRPEITQLPEGASVSGLAIISADRRYVRITPAPFFSQVGDVTTFNFVSGDTGAGGAGGGIGGLGGAGGGLGGQGFN